MNKTDKRCGAILSISTALAAHIAGVLLAMSLIVITTFVVALLLRYETVRDAFSFAVALKRNP